MGKSLLDLVVDDTTQTKGGGLSSLVVDEDVAVEQPVKKKFSDIPQSIDLRTGLPMSLSGGENTAQIPFLKSKYPSPLPSDKNPYKIIQSGKNIDYDFAKDFIEQDINLQQGLKLNNSNESSDKFSLQNIPPEKNTIQSVTPKIQNDVEKQTILNSPEALKEYRKKRIDELDNSILQNEKEATPYDTGDYLSDPTAKFARSAGIFDNTEKQLAANTFKDYKKQLQESVVNAAKISVAKKYLNSNVPIDLKEVGNEYLKTIGDNEINDDNEVLANVDKEYKSGVNIKAPDGTIIKADNNKRDIDVTKENIQYKLYKNGADVMSDYFSVASDNAYEIAKPKIETLSVLFNRQEQAATPEDKEIYQRQINHYLSDPSVQDYLGSTRNALDYYDKSLNAVNNFPQVKRQQLRQQVNDAYMEQVLNKSYSSNPAIDYGLNSLATLYHSLVGSVPDAKDIIGIAKTLGIDEKEVQSIANENPEGLFGKAPSGIRTSGLLVGLAKGTDEQLAKSLMGVKRFLDVDNVESKNRVLQDKLNIYNTEANANKLKDDLGKWNINPFSIFNTMGRGVGQTEVFALPALVSGGFTAEGTIAEKLVEASSTIGSGYAGSYEDAYKEAAKYTNKEDLRRSYANITAFENALPELLLSPADILKKVSGAKKVLGKEAFEMFAKDATEKGVNEAVKDRMIAGVKEFANVIGAENIEEAVTNVTNNITKQQMFGVKMSPNDWVNQAIETAVQTTITTLPLGVGAGINGTQDVSGIRKEGLFEAGNEPDLYKEKLQGLFNSGVFNQQELNERTQVVNTMQNIVANVNKTTKADGKPLSYEEKRDLAAQQFRIQQNEAIKKNGNVLAAQVQHIEDDTQDALLKQNEILFGTAKPLEETTATVVEKKEEPKINEDAGKPQAELNQQPASSLNLPNEKETKAQEPNIEATESNSVGGDKSALGDKKTNTIGGYEFTKTPSLEDGVEVKDISDLSKQIESDIYVGDGENVLRKGVKYLSGGWYEVGTDSFGGTQLFNAVTKEAVELNHKKGGRSGIVINDFLKNNSRYNDNIAVRGSKFTEAEHNPKFGGSGHYKGTYFYVGLSSESKALEHGKNLSRVDISDANLYELGVDGVTSQTLKNEAKKAGYDTRDASGYAESDYLKKQGYDGIKRGNEIVLFEPNKFKTDKNAITEPSATLDNANKENRTIDGGNRRGNEGDDTERGRQGRQDANTGTDGEGNKQNKAGRDERMLTSKEKAYVVNNAHGRDLDTVLNEYEKNQKEGWQLNKSDYDTVFNDVDRIEEKIKSQNELDLKDRKTQLRLEQGKLDKLNRLYDGKQMPTDADIKKIKDQKVYIGIIEGQLKEKVALQENIDKEVAKKVVEKYPNLFEDKETFPFYRSKGGHKDLVSKAIKNKDYETAISEGRITANDAKKIIESAKLEVPKDIIKLAENENKISQESNIKATEGSGTDNANVPSKESSDTKTTLGETIPTAGKEQGVSDKEGFTEVKDLNRIYADLKQKHGDKKGAAIYEAANRLVNPNKNTIVDIRSNGVTVKEGEKYIFNPFGNTDANSKKWTLYKGIDVTDQYIKSEPPPQTELENKRVKEASNPVKKSVLDKDIKEVSVEDILKELKDAKNKKGLRTKDISNDVLKSGNKDAIENYVERARSVLKTLFPDATLETFGSEKEYIKAGGEEGTRGIGLLEKNGKHRILLNLEKISEDNSGKTAYHEVIHPILYEAYSTKPDELNTLWNDVASDLKDVKGMDAVLQHASLYNGREAGMEGLTEFLAQVADGNIDLKDAKPSTIQRAIDLINKVLKAIGIDYKFNNVKDFTEFAQKIKQAFETGNAEALKGEIKGTNIDKVYEQLEKTRELEPDKQKRLIELLDKKLQSEVAAGRITKEDADNILNDATEQYENKLSANKDVADKIRKLKIIKGNKAYASIFSLPVSRYDEALDKISDSMEKTGDLQRAIRSGIDYIKSKDKEWSDEGDFFAKHIEDFVSGAKPKLKVQVKSAEPEPTQEETDKQNAKEAKKEIDGYDLTTSDETNKFLSGATWEDIFGEKPEGNQTYIVQKLTDMLQDGKNMIAIAQQKWGNDIMDYGKKLFSYIQTMDARTGNAETNKKAVLLATFLGEIKEAIANEPNRANEIKKLEAVVLDYYQHYMNAKGKQVVAGRLLRLYRDKYIGDAFANVILEKEQVDKKETLSGAEKNTTIPDDVAVKSNDTITEEEKNKEDKADKERKKKSDKKQEGKKTMSTTEAQQRANEKLKEIQNKLGDEKEKGLVAKINDLIKKINCP